MVQVKIGQQLYPASVRGTVRDGDWDGRESKAITLAMAAADAAALFSDNTAWSIQVDQPSYPDPDTGETVMPDPAEFDNSDFCVAGDVTDHRDGTVTVKMGKLTALEETLLMIYGGEEE